jgi:hypothetical protein
VCRVHYEQTVRSEGAVSTHARQRGGGVLCLDSFFNTPVPAYSRLHSISHECSGVGT